MATRSAIGYQLPSGKVRSVYCHWDGYPSHHLPILQSKYNSIQQVVDLVRPGSMSSLETDKDWNDQSMPPGPLYHAQRGKGPWCASDGTYSDPPITSHSVSAAIKRWRDCYCEHLYVYTPDTGWQHHEL